MNNELIRKASKILIITSARTGGTYLKRSLSHPITNRVSIDEPFGDNTKVVDGKIVWEKKVRDGAWWLEPKYQNIVIKTHVVHHIQIHSEGPHPPPFPYSDEAIEKGKEQLKSWIPAFDYTIFLKRRNKFLHAMSYQRAKEWTLSVQKPAFEWNYLKREKSITPNLTNRPVKIDILALYRTRQRNILFDKIIDELSPLGDEVVYYEDIEFKDYEDLPIKFPPYERTILNYQECVDAWEMM